MEIYPELSLADLKIGTEVIEKTSNERGKISAVTHYGFQLISFTVTYEDGLVNTYNFKNYSLFCLYKPHTNRENHKKNLPRRY
jgi:hypothetical protein